MTDELWKEEKRNAELIKVQGSTREDECVLLIQEDKQTVIEKPRNKYVGFAILAVSFASVSSLGVAFDLERGVPPVLKLFWKVSGSCMVLFCIILGQILLKKGALPHMENPRDTIRRILLCAAGFTVWNASFNWALAHTSVAHVYVLNNCHSLLMVVWRAVSGDALVFAEGFGSVVGIAGSIVTAMDHDGQSSNSDIVGPSMYGDIGAFLGAIGAVLYFLQAKVISTRMPFLFFMLCHSFTVCMFLLPTMWCLGESYELSSNPSNGLFGWANWQLDRLPIEIYLVVICDFGGRMGFIRVLAYFDPLVVSITMLMQPILAAFFGVAAGVATVPGLITCIGSVIVIAGTALVISSSTAKPKSLSPKKKQINKYGSLE
ncbi:Drug/Metabolite Transporter (DMT) Superfamily [Thraustotheca clavata]|uniref:Drug/Metabolite Transporter (DMT) Superfamily n=1 Tax=Thraustotheca clavata TaxID=74557 RepID=A0A1W0AB49_9STRA|nr:Drug/Metabolite Transporter (DMT) Superfamily [Thraustotheca clavata]